MSEMESLLEDVAREMARRLAGSLEGQTPVYAGLVIPIIKRRLLPLLEAGQALATPYGDGIDQLLGDYHSALSATRPVKEKV